MFQIQPAPGTEAAPDTDAFLYGKAWKYFRYLKGACNACFCNAVGGETGDVFPVKFDFALVAVVAGDQIIYG